MTERLMYNRITGNIMLNGKLLNDGQRLKVLIMNENNTPEWIYTRLLKNVDNVWVLENYWQHNPIGLYAELLKPLRREPV